MDIDPPPSNSTPDAPDKEKMEQIRKRRLEKLGGSTAPKKEKTEESTVSPTASSLAPTAATKDPSENVPKPKSDITKTPTSSTPNPFTKLNAGAAKGNTPPLPTVRSQSSQNNLKRPRTESLSQTPSQAPPQVRKVSTPASVESITTWEDHTLEGIFRVTLVSGRKVDAHGHRLIDLPGQRQDLEDENLPLLLSRDRLDGIILEAASTIPHDRSILDYLLPCWKRVIRAQKALRGYASDKDTILKEAKRLCMSYMLFAVDVPDLFGREANFATDSLAPYFLHDHQEDRGIDLEFMTEITQRFEEDDSAKFVLRKALAALSLQLSSMSMADNYKPYMEALKLMCRFPLVMTAITEDPLFQMATSAPGIEKHTLLGPFFRISPLQPEVTKEYFGSPQRLDKRTVAVAQDALRLTLQSYQADLIQITGLFVRASAESRNKILAWFAYIVNSNQKRRAIRPDPASLSSDGFLINITVVLDSLCDPFVDATFSKIGKIEIDYFRREPRVDISQETKLNADQNGSDEFYKSKASGTSNFISEVFFLTLAAHHYGTEASNSMLKSLDKDVKYLQEQMAKLEAERTKIPPAMLPRYEEQVRRFTEVLDKSLSLKYAIEGVLYDKPMQTKTLQFNRFVTVWLLRVASQSDYRPEKALKLPLSSQMPDQFRYLPEYVLEDILTNFTFILRHMPDLMISAVGDELIALCITFLTNSEYIKNPYLKAKLVSVLFHGSYQIYHRQKGIFGDALTSSKFANDYLLHALLKFYIEVEQTGVHTQFYDKFNIRYEIFQVVKCIWTNDVYRLRLTQESKTNTEFFLRFVNLLLNDATFVLDEALTKFPKIHDLQEELRQVASPLTEEQRTAKQEELAAAESAARNYMQLTNETISMMKLFSESLSASFTMPEIVDRVAAMVDYTLDTIVGPKSANLRVEDPKKYQFHPKTLLSEFIDIYLNLSVSESFIDAVARDGRSYKPSNFDAAIRIVTRHSLKSGEDIARFAALKERFRISKEIEDQQDEDLGEIPDEYADPIMATLMLDPVILPTSRQTVDRSTIRSHLLSDPTDLFNRQPLKIEDVVDNVALREEIVKWRDERRAKAKAERVAAVEGTMDTS